MRSFKELKTILDQNGQVIVSSEEANLFNPDIFSFHWNKDYTKALVVPLPYWDDISYIKYQGHDPQE